MSSTPGRQDAEAKTLEAKTEKAAVLPTTLVWFWGWVVMTSWLRPVPSAARQLARTLSLASTAVLSFPSAERFSFHFMSSFGTSG
jgi:hypothetical protein